MQCTRWAAAAAVMGLPDGNVSPASPPPPRTSPLQTAITKQPVPARPINCTPECFASADAKTLHPSSPMPFPAHQTVTSSTATRPTSRIFKHAQPASRACLAPASPPPPRTSPLQTAITKQPVPWRLILCKPECFASADAKALHPSSPMPFAAHQTVTSSTATRPTSRIFKHAQPASHACLAPASPPHIPAPNRNHKTTRTLEVNLLQARVLRQF